MQAWVPSGQTRFIHGMHSKFRCRMRAFSLRHGQVCVNLVGPKSAIVGVL